MTKNRIKTTSKKKDIETTTLQQKTTSLTSSYGKKLHKISILLFYYPSDLDVPEYSKGDYRN